MKRFLKTVIKKKYFPKTLKYIIKTKIEDRDISKWVKRGKPIPPPHIVKQRTLIHYAKKFNLNILVETGTYYGIMIEAMKENFKNIYSIELSKELYKLAKEKFKTNKNITLIQGDSGIELKKIVNKINEPTLFWLDGHYSGGITAKSDTHTPILDELSHIFKITNLNHVIIIDDAHAFNNDPSYPKINTLTDYIISKKPNSIIKIEDNMIRILPNALN